MGDDRDIPPEFQIPFVERAPDPIGHDDRRGDQGRRRGGQVEQSERIFIAIWLGHFAMCEIVIGQFDLVFCERAPIAFCPAHGKIHFCHTVDQADGSMPQFDQQLRRSIKGSFIIDVDPIVFLNCVA